MLKGFADKTTRDIYDGVNSKQARRLPRHLHVKAQRLLDQINVSTELEVLAAPPGNRLEKLHGDLAGFWSLCINEQWRIIFRWHYGDAFDVQIVDYHR